METIHKEVLDLHHQRLVTSLRANDVIDRLLKENAINKYDYDQLKRTEAQGPRAMNRLLLMTLRRKGPAEAFPAFQRSLLDSGQKDLHDHLRMCELDLLEGLVTERLQEAVDSYGGGGGGGVGGGDDGSSSELRNREPNGLNGHLDLDLGRDDPHSPAINTTRPESPIPVLRKASSPALKNRGLPRNPSTPRTSSNRQSFSTLPSRAKETSTPPSSSSPKDREDEERDRQLKQLEEEVRELRKSYSKMENDMKQHIERLEQEKKKGEETQGKKKKDGGCTVM